MTAQPGPVTAHALVRCVKICSRGRRRRLVGRLDGWQDGGDSVGVSGGEQEPDRRPGEIYRDAQQGGAGGHLHQGPRVLNSLLPHGRN